MVTFLAINTSGLAVLPTSMIALRSGLGASYPGSILLTTLCATACSTVVGVFTAQLLQKWRRFRVSDTVEGPNAPTVPSHDMIAPMQPYSKPKRTAVALAAPWIGLISVIAFGYAFYTNALRNGWFSALKTASSEWVLLAIIAAILIYGLARGIDVYDAMVEGGKEGFATAIRVIPYLVVMLTAVGMLRAAGVLDALVTALAPLTNLVGMPPETLPMALLRPLSGSGSYGLAADIMREHGRIPSSGE